MQDGGYIEINRSILEREWYQEKHTIHLLFYILLSADEETGILVTSLNRLLDRLNIKEDILLNAFESLYKIGIIETYCKENKFNNYTKFIIAIRENEIYKWHGNYYYLEELFLINVCNSHSRNTPEYRKFRAGVLKRDNYTCQECNKRDCILHVHHIKKFSKFPTLQTRISNGITLCEECHRNKHRSINNGR